jgi:putative SOS response-associated peptidase YedK
MCGRYSLAGPNPAQVRSAYPVGEELEVRQRFNVAPGDQVLAITADREGRPRGELLRWGFVPPWSETPPPAGQMINARSETVAERPAFRTAFTRMRCLVLADGFYEWQRTAVRPKQPFHITAAERELFAFAGLWSVWHAADGSTLRSCTILTTSANAAIAPLHDRMPVILPRSAEPLWLAPEMPAGRLHELLGGLSADETIVRAVGPAVSDARYDGPECLAEPVQAQATLF